MDELKYLTNKNNIQQITVGLQKLLKSIRSEKGQGSKENQIKEIDYLRELCTSEYTNLSLLAHQAFVRLVEDGTIEAATCLSMFMTMLPNAKYNQYTAISEGVVDLLLLDLKRRSALVDATKTYVCPFGLRAPQHPIIILMQKNESNLIDLTNKINGICNHHDKEIRQHSIEFLRPVFLYTLCNLVSVPDSMTIWTCLLTHVKKSNKAMELVDEILCYRKTDSAEATMKTSLLLSDAVTIMVANNNVDAVIRFALYLTAVLNDLVAYGYDPRPGFRIIRQAISEIKHLDSFACDLLLILLNQSLHNVSPVYLSDVVRLLKLIIITKCGGNRVTHFMILDGLIIWIANFSLVPVDGLHGIKELIDFIMNSDRKASNHNQTSSSTIVNYSNVKFYHPSVAIGFQLAAMSNRIDTDITSGKTKALNEFVDSVQEPSQLRFSDQINLFLRGIFLNDNVPPQFCLKIFKILLKIVMENQDVATGLLLPVLFKLSREKEPIVQLELLRGLTQFAVVKENIPTILNTLNSMTSGSLRTLALDLYMRLWKQENRTYPFLHKLLHDSKDNKKTSNELTIAKAFTIKEICELKPTQHGTDLVVHLSNILNQSSSSEGETSTTIAMEAIIILCNSHTINISSTWKALSQKFENEERKRPIMALCKFFGQVPLLRSPTVEYEQLYSESITKLWNYVVDSDCSEIISTALRSLQNFDYCGFTLAQIPEIFRQNLLIPTAYTKLVNDVKTQAVDVLDYIPGQCWVQLIQKIDPTAMESASDLVSHYIHNEIDSYRGGVYHLPEGKPEPNNLKQLHNRSPLRFVVEYLMTEAKNPTKGNERVVLNCLRCLSRKFPKPIPPLDMYFLIHFMNDDIETKKYSIRILANQIVQSGTAKNLLENYVTKLNENQLTDSQEVQIVLDVLVEIVNGISVNISEKLMRRLFEFSLNKCQQEPLIFESVLESTKLIFTESRRNEEAVEMVVGIIESCFDSIDPNTQIFQKFMQVCEHLPLPRLNAMTSPATWKDVSSNKFRKATLIRCYLATNSRRLDNPLFCLNPIVDNVSKFKSDQSFVLQNIAIILHRYGKELQSVSNWTMDIQSRVQAALLEKNENSEFLMDLFMLCIVVSSGCSTLFGSVENVATCRQSRLDGFPVALHLLSEQAFWRDCTVRIFEFLFHIYTNGNLSVCYVEAAKNALICTKNDFYFAQKTNWMKYIGLRRR